MSPLMYITDAPVQPWNVEITYKTIRAKVSSRESDDKPQTTGESLYVVKSNEFHDHTYMMVSQACPRQLLAFNGPAIVLHDASP